MLDRQTIKIALHAAYRIRDRELRIRTVSKLQELAAELGTR